MARCPQSDR